MSAGLFIMLIVILMAGLIVFGAHQARQRREALQAWATGGGWVFLPDKDHALDDDFPEFSCLREGSDRYGFNRVSGEFNRRRFLSFDYHYETESRDSKGNRTTTSHYFSGIIIRSNVPLKPLHIRPENLFDKVTEFFGVDDIDFESAEFSRRFFVKAEDRRWAFDVIHQRAMEFLLAQPGFTIQFSRTHVMIWKPSRFDVPEFQTALDVATGLLDGFPEYLVKQQMQA